MKKCRNMLNNQISEIITSETRYLNFLRKVQNYFEAPMVKLQILPENAVRELFGPIETIIKVSDVLLENFLIMDIAQSFLKVIPFLKVYGEYAKRYNDIIFSVETYKLNSSSMRTFIQTQETRPEVSQRLQSLLIMPIQRIPRYEIILKECCLTLLDLDGLNKNECGSLISLVNQKRDSLSKFKNNESFYQCLIEEIKKDSEYKEINSLAYDLREQLNGKTVDYLRAYAGILALGNSINEEVRQNENQKFIQLLQAKFRNTKDQAVLISPSRRLIKYGLIKKVNSRSSSIHNRFFILTTDCFIYCRVERSSFGTLNRSRKIALNSSNDALVVSKLKTIFNSTLPKPSSSGRPLSAIFPSYETASLHSRLSSFSSEAAGPDELNIWDDFSLSCIATFPLHKSCLICLNDKENVSPPNTRSIVGRESLNSLLNNDFPLNADSVEDCRNSCKLFLFSCKNEKLVLFFDYDFDACDWSNAILSAIEESKRTRETLQRLSSSESDLSIVDKADTSLVSNFSTFFTHFSHKSKPVLELDQTITRMETSGEKHHKIASKHSICTLS